jgi:hypothetical protein
MESGKRNVKTKRQVVKYGNKYKLLLSLKTTIVMVYM